MQFWPDTLPRPEITFSAAAETNALRLDMEVGTSRQRQRFTSGKLIGQVSWSFTQEELELFIAFLALRLENGTALFLMAFNLGGIERLYAARFPEGKYSTPYDVAGFWKVTAQIEFFPYGFGDGGGLPPDSNSSNGFGPDPVCPLAKRLRFFIEDLVLSTVPVDPGVYISIPPVVTVVRYSTNYWTLTDNRYRGFRRASYDPNEYSGYVYNVTCSSGVLHVTISLWTSPYEGVQIFDGYGLQGIPIVNELADDGVNVVIGGTVTVRV